MRILVLGGTVFLGRHVVEAALARDHEVTLLNRGLHGAQLFGDAVERLLGDRDGDLRALEGRLFDAVIDCSGYTPEHVDRTLAALQGSTPHIVFVSTVSVYERFPPGRTYDESAACAGGHEGYGPLKARAEDVIRRELPHRHTILRPGLIVGPHDPTGRFTYWPQRILRGGEILAPGRPQRPIQFIDARDMAAFCVRMAETASVGTFNVAAPRMSMQDLLEACRSNAAGPETTFTWIDDTTLLAWGVAPWTQLPLWLPETDPDVGGMLLADTTRAFDAGLTTRPVADVVADVLAWARSALESVPGAGKRVATLEPQHEAECLAQWRSSLQPS